MATASLLMGCVLPYSAWATDSNIHEVTSDGKRETVVTYDKGASFMVTVPKRIVLDSETKSAEYSISVKGDIPSDSKVDVRPEDAISDVKGINFYMVEQAVNKKADVAADVTQKETEWTSIEVTPTGTSKKGSVSAPDLTSGKWQGTFMFNIKLFDINADHIHTYVDGICTECGEKDPNAEVHIHSYTENITKQATCTEAGEKTLTCTCGDTKTESIPATGHTYVEGICTECGEKDPEYSQAELSAGLYDSNGTMLASWDELINTYGLDIQSDYTASTYKTKQSSLYHILYNNDEFSTASKLIIGDGVVQVGDYAAYGCAYLTDVCIPDSVMTIGDSAFQGCKLTSIEIPDSVDTIERDAFAYMSTLTSAVIGARVIEENAFYCGYGSHLTTLELKEGVQKVGAYAFSGAAITCVEFPSTVTTIGNSAFQSCKNLASVYIPSSITLLYFSDKSYGPFYSSSPTLKIYCEHESVPALNASHTYGWWDWDYYNASTKFTTKWGVPREVYETVYK